MTYFNEAKQKARELYYPPPKKRKLKTRNMAKKIDPQKKLLITAIKKTINKNTVLPILESVLLTGETAIVSDLETGVVIPYKTGVNVAVPSDKFIDCLDMMEEPVLVQDAPTILKEEIFECGGAMYLGRREGIEEKLSDYNDTKGEGEEITLAAYVEKYYDKVPDDYEPHETMHPNHGVTFSSGKRVVKVLGDDPDNFPLIPLTDKDYPVIGRLTEADMEKLDNALSFVSNDDLRPAMTGVLLGKKIVSTDAHRMYFDDLSEPVTREFILPAKAAKILLALGGEWELSTTEDYKKDDAGEIVLERPTIIELHEPVFFYVNETDEEDGILPRQGVREDALADYEKRAEWEQDHSFKQWIGNDYPIIDPEEKIKMKVPDMTKEPVATLLEFSNVCFTRNDGVKVVTRKIDARYPDYQCVIPQDEPNTVATVNPDELLKELKNAGKFANKSTNQVTFGVNGKLSIAAQDIDFSYEYTNELEQVEIQHNSGEGFNIAFNAKFLTEIVTKEKNNPIAMKLWSPTKCAIINEKFLIMPLMLNQ